MGGAGDVVAFVDDDGIPVLLAQVADVLIALQGVDRDDRPLVVGERVAVAGQLLADALDADRVESDERQREARPHLELHLLENVTRGHDQDAFPAAAPHQLRKDHPDL